MEPADEEEPREIRHQQDRVLGPGPVDWGEQVEQLVAHEPVGMAPRAGPRLDGSEAACEPDRDIMSPERLDDHELHPCLLSSVSQLSAA